MNDSELLRNRAYRAEAELEEERRFCERCYGQHRHTLQMLHAKLAEVELERDQLKAALAAHEERVKP